MRDERARRRSPVVAYVHATWAGATWRQIGYHLIGLPVGIGLFTYAITMYALGVSLAVIWVGLILLVAAQASMRPLGAFERSLANGMLDAGIDPPGPPPAEARGGPSVLRRMFAPFHDGHAWRVLAWVLMRGVLGPVGFALAVVAAVVPLSLAAAWLLAVGYLVGIVPGPDAVTDAYARGVVDDVAYWTVVGTPMLVIAIPMFAWLIRGWTALIEMPARWALGPCDSDRADQAIARARLAEERVRIDQELHDSIGHMITMNIVQAGAGAHVFDTDPEFARQALRNIEDRGRVAMAELDRIIAHIRGDEPPRAPLPDITRLPDLVEASRAAGLEVDADLSAGPVPPALSRAAYAIAREGITNAARHAAGAPIHLHVSTGDDALAVAVRNGPGDGSAPVAGVERAQRRHGLAGLHDRVSLLGGTSMAGPRSDGGFDLLALLPLELTLGPDSAPASSRCCNWDALRAKVGA